MTRLYLSGPMRGYPSFNVFAFHRATGHLRKLGYDVFSPAERKEHGEKSLAYYMALDLPEVCAADAVAVLPGWQDSQGAQLEVYVARECGKPILDAETLEPVT